MSITTVSGQPVVMHLNNALNGLRSASLEWLLHLQKQLSGLGLTADGAEPCFLSGKLTTSGKLAMIIVYVDDLAVATENKEDFQVILQALSKILKVKHTGEIDENGGQVKFLGRQISRVPGEHALYVSVPDDYLQKTFEEWGLKQTNQRIAASNILTVLDQGTGTESLSPEAHTRFRSTLGKIAWLSQTRQDLKHYVALPGTAQSSPNQASEKALKMLLRFLSGDPGVALKLPADDETFGDTDEFVVTAYTDASHAPSTRNRRGVSGGVMAYLKGLVKTYSRHQTSVSLSSCESKLQGIQQICQEGVVIARLLTRILKTFGMIQEGQHVVCRVSTDSESALKRLKGIDLPRRSRHITIKVEWLRELIEQGMVDMVYLRGQMLPADALTKCLATERFLSKEV